MSLGPFQHDDGGKMRGMIEPSEQVPELTRRKRDRPNPIYLGSNGRGLGFQGLVVSKHYGILDVTAIDVESFAEEVDVVWKSDEREQRQAASNITAGPEVKEQQLQFYDRNLENRIYSENRDAFCC
ncbi:hypothetical protein NDU88_005236 [Pleurodeles waltl]|uniref:Uncharacterized protein n=1 Tax=Pleurodeles waltl TaxID=8319 RepID=A0AAV7WYX8_PLEWA|nr:hypothetical protein NDU88_005236 [Pleurodeles waltl]